MFVQVDSFNQYEHEYDTMERQMPFLCRKSIVYICLSYMNLLLAHHAGNSLIPKQG